MKVARGGLARALDQPDPAIRFYLFYGNDESQSRAHGQRLRSALGATRVALTGSAVKSDPALIAAEASALSLFDGPRLVWVEPAGDEIAEGVQALFDAAATESPVVAIAGALRKTSALVKLAEASPLALANVSYVPEGQDAERMVVEVGRTLGLKIPSPVAARIAQSCGNDQAVVRRELEKLGLYVDAAPEMPKELTHDAVDEVGADMPEGDFMRLADFALSGRMKDLADELAGLVATGGDIRPVLSALQRRLLLLAPLRARVERGERPDAVMTSVDKSLFYKEKPVVNRLLQQWDAASLARLVDRSGKLARDTMLNSMPPLEGLAEELVAVARAAQRR
ncbi:DNA polymerase III subunit delta [Sphingomonas piscis]|uniref:DNA-directed DNA polymerase n=1 Tax=Sphingomonas piscis TaxID=2714943 RepID=A0A6G7YPM9_9SPHN|nr:DNA polymerase III subunit delta [Sphingomonas piscis]QIK78694.1 DNA polymerase III subunit delta [Sphingomonas piscis]